MSKLDFIKKLYNGKNCYSDHMNEDELGFLHIPSGVEQLVSDMLDKHKLVFLTGNPGDGKTYIIKASAVYYIESVDKKSFVYTKQGCYDTKYRLYELEVMLGGYFMRCSKSMIINLKKVRNVKSQISGRIDATLLNDEVVVISRGYVKEVKRRLGIG